MLLSNFEAIKFQQKNYIPIFNAVPKMCYNFLTKNKQIVSSVLDITYKI